MPPLAIGLDLSRLQHRSRVIWCYREKKKLPLVNRKIIWHPEFRFELKEQKGQTEAVDLRNAERYFPGIGGKRKSLSSQASPRIELGTFANECNFTLSLEELKQFVLR